jgi:Zn-dependent protease
MLSLILNALRGGSGIEASDIIAQLLAVLLIIFLILPFHEWAHAFTASCLGDKGIKSRGRLSLNPLNHADPIGALCMILFGFGWAKPVPIDARYFKNPKIGMAITAAMGPIANLVASFVGCLLYIGLYFFAPAFISESIVGEFITVFLSYYISLNIGLAVFNLIPIPPLDGSKILFVFLPNNAVSFFYRYQNIFFIGLFALIYMGTLDGVMSWANDGIFNAIWWLASLPFRLLSNFM